LPGRRTPLPTCEVTNTRSPDTIGDDTPSPLSGAFQRTFSAGAPAIRQVLVVRDAVAVRAAPLRPVGGERRSAERQRHDGRDRERAQHSDPPRPEFYLQREGIPRSTALSPSADAALRGLS
jgi:hypothetical protein